MKKRTKNDMVSVNKQSIDDKPAKQAQTIGVIEVHILPECDLHPRVLNVIVFDRIVISRRERQIGARARITVHIA
jgi:hypothetical protein